MGLFDSREKQKLLILGEDFRGKVKEYPIEGVFSVEKKGDKLIKAWYMHPDLIVPFNWFGKDMGHILVVNNRDFIFDPLKTLGKDWEKDEVKKRLAELAKEEEHRAVEKKTSQTMERSTMWLSIAAVVLFMAIAVVGLLKFNALRLG